MHVLAESICWARGPKTFISFGMDGFLFQQIWHLNRTMGLTWTEDSRFWHDYQGFVFTGYRSLVFLILGAHHPSGKDDLPKLTLMMIFLSCLHNL